jgi:hypothetical protein
MKFAIKQEDNYNEDENKPSGTWEYNNHHPYFYIIKECDKVWIINRYEAITLFVPAKYVGGDIYFIQNDTLKISSDYEICNSFEEAKNKCLEIHKKVLAEHEEVVKSQRIAIEEIEKMTEKDFFSN